MDEEKQVFLYFDEATNTHWTFVGVRGVEPDLESVPAECKYSDQQEMLDKAAQLAQEYEVSCLWIG